MISPALVLEILGHKAGCRALDVAFGQHDARGQFGRAAGTDQCRVPGQRVAHHGHIVGPRQHIAICNDKAPVGGVRLRHRERQFDGARMLAGMAAAHGQRAAAPRVQPPALSLRFEHPHRRVEIALRNERFGQTDRVARLVGAEFHHRLVQRQAAPAIAGIEQKVSEVGQRGQLAVGMRPDAERDEALGEHAGFLLASEFRERACGAHPVIGETGIRRRAGTEILRRRGKILRRRVHAAKFVIGQVQPAAALHDLTQRRARDLRIATARAEVGQRQQFGDRAVGVAVLVEEILQYAGGPRQAGCRSVRCAPGCP